MSANDNPRYVKEGPTDYSGKWCYHPDTFYGPDYDGPMAAGYPANWKLVCRVCRASASVPTGWSGLARLDPQPVQPTDSGEAS